MDNHKLQQQVNLLKQIQEIEYQIHSLIKQNEAVKKVNNSLYKENKENFDLMTRNERIFKENIEEIKELKEDQMILNIMREDLILNKKWGEKLERF